MRVNAIKQDINFLLGKNSNDSATVSVEYFENSTRAKHFLDALKNIILQFLGIKSYQFRDDENKLLAYQIANEIKNITFDNNSFTVIGRNNEIVTLEFYYNHNHILAICGTERITIATRLPNGYIDVMKANVNKIDNPFGLTTLGEASTMSNLAYMYKYGQGVDINYPKAIELYTKAAALGNESAMSNLAFLQNFINNPGIKFKLLYQSRYAVSNEKKSSIKKLLSENQDFDCSISTLHLDAMEHTVVEHKTNNTFSFYDFNNLECYISYKKALKKPITSPLTNAEMTIYNEEAKVLPQNCWLTPDQFIAYMQSK